MSIVEPIAVAFGLACVWLTVRQSIWCWPTGLVQVILYIWIFLGVRLYSDVVLHVVYVAMQLYGWHAWLHGGPRRQALAVSRLGVRRAAAAALAVAGLTAFWGFGMAHFTDASLPYADAFTTVASLVAQWLLTRKKLEAWALWVAVDLAAVGVYLVKGLTLTACLYAVFLGLAVQGWRTWQLSLAGVGRLEEGG